MGDEEIQIKVETAKFDARFPNCNQTKNCWQNYVDYQKCVKQKGEDFAPCDFFKKTYKSLCPIAWVSFQINKPFFKVFTMAGEGVNFIYLVFLTMPC